jgi:hypothetical protein
MTRIESDADALEYAHDFLRAFQPRKGGLPGMLEPEARARREEAMPRLERMLRRERGE